MKSSIDLSDHYHILTLYHCDYCKFDCAEEETMDSHLQDEHWDMIEKHIMRNYKEIK